MFQAKRKGPLIPYTWTIAFKERGKSPSKHSCWHSESSLALMIQKAPLKDLTQLHCAAAVGKGSFRTSTAGRRIKKTILPVAGSQLTTCLPPGSESGTRPLVAHVKSVPKAVYPWSFYCLWPQDPVSEEVLDTLEELIHCNTISQRPRPALRDQLQPRRIRTKAPET